MAGRSVLRRGAKTDSPSRIVTFRLARCLHVVNLESGMPGKSARQPVTRVSRSAQGTCPLPPRPQLCVPRQKISGHVSRPPQTNVATLAVRTAVLWVSGLPGQTAHNAKVQASKPVSGRSLETQALVRLNAQNCSIVALVVQSPSSRSAAARANGPGGRSAPQLATRRRMVALCGVSQAGPEHLQRVVPTALLVSVVRKNESALCSALATAR